MLRPRLILALLCLAGNVVLGGCAAGGLGTPSMANIDRIVKGTLSPAEQKAAIDELQDPVAADGSAAPTPLVKATTADPAE